MKALSAEVNKSLLIITVVKDEVAKLKMSKVGDLVAKLEMRELSWRCGGYVENKVINLDMRWLSWIC